MTKKSAILRDNRSGDIFGAGGAMGGAGKAGGGGEETENTLYSTAVASILDIVSEGPIEGLYNGLKSVYLNDVPIENFDGSRNFNGIDIEGRIGTEDQAPNTLFSDTESEVGVGTEVRKGLGPVTRNINGDFDGFRVRVRIPSLMKVDEDGNLVAHSVSFSILWAPEGSGNFQHITGSPFTVSGKTNSAYYVDYEFDPPTDGPWDVRMYRESPDETEVRNSSDTYWDAWVGILRQKMIYPWSAYLAFNAYAEQFGGSIPRRTYDIKGRIIRVPSNYNPVTREYSGFWDGSFKIAWTDNPAWVCLDLATNRRYGAGMDDNEINIAALYQIAKYCDEMVPDGRNGIEPRYTINVVINNREEAYSLFNKISTTFRGMMYWANGQMSFSQDAPKPVSYVVSPANTEKGMFVYRSTTSRSRANRIVVTYASLANKGQPDYVMVDRNEDIVRNGIKQVEIQAWGTNSEGQARRIGEWMMYTLWHDTEVVSYTAGVDHDGIHPGQIIAVADPTKTSQKIVAGRIKSAPRGSNKVVLDRTLQLSASQLYQIMMSDKDRVMRYYDIVTPTQPTDTITLAAPIATDIEGHSMWTIFEKETGQKQFQVTSVNERGGRRVVSALLYNPSKFDYIERDRKLDDPPRNTFDEGQLKGPRFFNYSVARVNQPGTANRIDLLLTWTAPEEDNRVVDYIVQYADTSETPAWDTVYTGRDTKVTIPNVSGVPKAARIQARGIGGLVSPWQTITNIELNSRTVPPQTPSTLTVVQESIGKSLRVSWNYAGGRPPDFQHVEIYRSLTMDVNQATLIGTETGSYFLDTNLQQGTMYYYWVRTVVHTDNPAAKYSAMFGPQAAVALAPPLFDILDDSITAEKIATAAVTADALMQGAVTALKLATGSVVADKIAANAVTGDKVVANAITAKHLVLTDFTNMVKNGKFSLPGTDDPSSVGWELAATSSVIKNNRANNRFELVHSTAHGAYSERFAVKQGDALLVKGFCYNTNGERATLLVQWLDGNGAHIDWAFDAFTDAKNTHALVSGKPVAPAGAVYARLSPYVGKSSDNGVKAYWSEIEVRRAANAELIVDGSIIAAKIGANAITTDKLAANSINGGHIQANSISGVHIVAKSLGADKISVGSLEALSANLGNVAIHGDLVIYGTVSTGKIAGDAVTSHVVSGVSGEFGPGWHGWHTGIYNAGGSVRIDVSLFLNRPDSGSGNYGDLTVVILRDGNWLTTRTMFYDDNFAYPVAFTHLDYPAVGYAPVYSVHVYNNWGSGRWSFKNLVIALINFKR